MTREEGNSFNRIYGFEGTRYPNRTDYERMRNIFGKLNGTLAYENGCKVTEENLKKVQEKLEE